MEQFREKVQRKKELVWAITLIYTAFSGCFSFPLSMPDGMRNWSSIFLSFGGWLMIGLFYAGLLRKGAVKVFFLSLLFTMLGMAGRYLLEFGEVSNAVNFTPSNVILYLILAPVVVTVTFLAAPSLLDHDVK